MEEAQTTPDERGRQIIRERLQKMPKTVPAHGTEALWFTFDTRAGGVGISAELRMKWPELMTVVLEHKYWDLMVRRDEFEVTLGFGGRAHRITIPYTSILAFAEPAAKVSLKLSPVAEPSPPPADLPPGVVSIAAFRRK